MPLRIARPAMTAEKLNIQPIDRSISRMARRNTIPRARMPVNAAFAKSSPRERGARKFGLAIR